MTRCINTQESDIGNWFQGSGEGKRGQGTTQRRARQKPPPVLGGKGPGGSRVIRTLGGSPGAARTGPPVCQDLESRTRHSGGKECQGRLRGGGTPGFPLFPTRRCLPSATLNRSPAVLGPEKPGRQPRAIQDRAATGRGEDLRGNSPGMAGGPDGSLKPQSRRVGGPEPFGLPSFPPHTKGSAHRAGRRHLAPTSSPCLADKCQGAPTPSLIHQAPSGRLQAQRPCPSGA